MLEQGCHHEIPPRVSPILATPLRESVKAINFLISFAFHAKISFCI